jgi:hypothetical protein
MRIDVQALSFFAALIAAFPVDAGQKTTEPESGFEVVFPDGWKTGRLTTITGPHIAGVLEQESGRAVCVFGVQDVALTKKLTQAKMNADLRTPLGRDFWRNNVYGSLGDVKFESDGVREHPSGIVIQEAEVTANGPGAASAIRLRLSSALYATPGKTYNSTCSALPASFESYRATFRAIVDSFRPNQGGLSASINQPPGAGDGSATVVPAAQVAPAELLKSSDKDIAASMFSKPEFKK